MPQRRRVSATPRPAPDRRTQVRGFVTVQFVTASALALVLFTGLANLVVFHYARGVVRAALDEGVRAGARAAAAADECEDRAGAVVRDLLGGPLGDEVAITCTASVRDVRAVADTTFHGWSPMVPDWSFTTRATSVREAGP